MSGFHAPPSSRSTITGTAAAGATLPESVARSPRDAARAVNAATCIPGGGGAAAGGGDGRVAEAGPQRGDAR